MVNTETTYFNAVAAKECYKDLEGKHNNERDVMQYLQDHGYTYDEATVDNLIIYIEGNKV